MKNKKNGVVNPGKEINFYVCVALLVLVPLILNWKIINYDFTKLDDTSIITNNYGFLSDFGNTFKSFEKDNFLSKDGKGYYRPVQTLSFMIDAHISGEKPWAYHLSNLLYHILTVISLFLLLRIIGIKNNLSFFFALLFSVHPLFTDAIAWIVGRGDILAGLFGTLAFIFFIKYNETKNKVFFLIHAAAFLLALFSKEISVVLPFVIIYYFWFVKNNKYKIRGLIPFIILWSLSVLFFFYLRNRFLNPQDILSIGSFIQNLPQIPILFAKMFLPFGLSPMPVFTVLYTAAGIIILILTGIYLLKLKSANIIPIIFGIIWFVAFMLPGMFLRIPLGKFHFEYLECRIYLPAIGIFLSVGVLLNDLIKKNEAGILLKFFILPVLIFSVLSFIYSEIFASPLEFYSSVIKSNPDNAYALCSRGNIYMSNGNFDKALVDFDNSIMAAPIYSEPYYDKGVLYAANGNSLLAENFYSEALKYDTLYPIINNLREYAFINLSAVKYSLKKFDETIDLLKKAELKYPGNGSIHNTMGLAYYAKAEYLPALSEYNRALTADSTVYTYFNNRGMVNYQLKSYKDAINDFNKSLNINPEFQDALTNRGITRTELSDCTGAISDLTSVINLTPNNRIALYFRGIAYSKLNMVTEAESDLKKASDLGFKMPSGK